MPAQADDVNDIYPTISDMPKHIAFYVFPGFQLLDLSGPLAVFETAEIISPGSYQTSVISEVACSMASSAGLRVEAQAPPAKPADTLVVAGGGGVHAAAASQAQRAAVRQAGARRTASVCTGAFLLAAAGLLDGKRATTHWHEAARLQAAYPRLRVDPDKIFIKDGDVWTSAGVTAGIDLGLALVEDDLGPDVSRAVARDLVVYHRRPGGQSQFSALLEMDPSSDRIRDALRFARDHLRERLPVERLAEAARLSPRQFGRLFAAETGHTPAKAVERLRAEGARPAVEDGIEPLDAIAAAYGFADPERMRQSFIRAFGQPPQALRRAARSRADVTANPGGSAPG